MIGAIAVLIVLTNMLTPSKTSLTSAAPILWMMQTDWEQFFKTTGWKNITSETTINSLLLRQNTTHLTISGNTPFASKPLISLIGQDGEYPVVDKILDGNINIDKILTDTTNLDPVLQSPEMKVFIESLKLPTSTATKSPLSTIPSKISLEEYKEMFNNTKEQTASTPPAHYGHYKASCESDILASVNLTFMNTPFKYGYALERWKISYHCMIKKRDVPYINQLRIVQLYEADFNSVLKFLPGKRMLQHEKKWNK